MLNRRNLEEEFQMTDEPIEGEVVEDNCSDPFEQEWEHDEDPRSIIRENIERANSILDRVEEELTQGNFTARLVEVAAAMVNSITAASKELIGDENYRRYLQIRERMVYLKKEEIELKKKKGNAPKNQNLIIASREDVLKMLREPQKQVECEDTDSTSEDE